MNMHIATAPLAARPSATADDRKLIALCKRGEKIAAEDHRIECHHSDMSDSFMDVETPPRPEVKGACVYLRGSTASEMRAELKERRASIAPASVVATQAYIGRFAEWEVEIRRLKAQHGLTAAERASKIANARTCKMVDEVVALPAETPEGLAARCRVMLACLKAGYGYDSQFEALAQSIFEDGARLGQSTKAPARPPRSDATAPAHH